MYSLVVKGSDSWRCQISFFYEKSRHQTKNSHSSSSQVFISDLTSLLIRVVSLKKWPLLIYIDLKMFCYWDVLLQFERKRFTVSIVSGSIRNTSFLTLSHKRERIHNTHNITQHYYTCLLFSQLNNLSITIHSFSFGLFFLTSTTKHSNVWYHVNELQNTLDIFKIYQRICSRRSWTNKWMQQFTMSFFWRTLLVPNVGSLLNCEADLLLLDCVGIDFDFPPKLSDSTSNFLSEYKIPSLFEEWKQISKQMFWFEQTLTQRNLLLL
jgi:hypothetical protein